MAKILFGWEIGAGLGHITRLVKIAKVMAAQGHEPIFVMRNLVETWPVMREAGFAAIQAPVWQSKPRPKGFVFKAAGMADIISWQGFDNVEDLFVMVRAWQNIIDLIRPDLIISDYSPTLNLAAYKLVPTIIIGDGFTLPPHNVETFPILRKVPNEVDQAKVYDVVVQVQKRRGQPVPDHLPRIFEGTARFVCTYPELDPYNKVRAEPAVGPFDPAPAPAETASAKSFFAYIASDFRHYKPAVLGIGESSWPASTYIRRCPQGTVQYLTGKGKAVYRKPAPMVEVLQANGAILHHGGIGTTEQALAVGRPQVLLVRHMEQMLTGRALMNLGVGVVVQGKVTPQLVGEGLRRALEGPKLAERATKIAQAIAARGYQDNTQRIAQAGHRLVS